MQPPCACQCIAWLVRAGAAPAGQQCNGAILIVCSRPAAPAAPAVQLYDLMGLRAIVLPRDDLPAVSCGWGWALLPAECCLKLGQHRCSGQLSAHSFFEPAVHCMSLPLAGRGRGAGCPGLLHCARRGLQPVGVCGGAQQGLYRCPQAQRLPVAAQHDAVRRAVLHAGAGMCWRRVGIDAAAG